MSNRVPGNPVARRRLHQCRRIAGKTAALGLYATVWAVNVGGLVAEHMPPWQAVAFVALMNVALVVAIPVGWLVISAMPPPPRKTVAWLSSPRVLIAVIVGGSLVLLALVLLLFGSPVPLGPAAQGFGTHASPESR
jgi:hypothetical protein